MPGKFICNYNPVASYR